MLDVQLYGLNAGGHHVTNIIFHVYNTLLLFWLLRWLTGRSWCSAAVAALFAVHPMHVESVVWIAERKDVLSTFLGLLALLAYVRYAKEPQHLSLYSRICPAGAGASRQADARDLSLRVPALGLLAIGATDVCQGKPMRRRRVRLERRVPRRRAKRNQRLPATARMPPNRPVVQQTCLRANRPPGGREDSVVRPVGHLRGDHSLCPEPRRLDGLHRRNCPSPFASRIRCSRI